MRARLEPSNFRTTMKYCPKWAFSPNCATTSARASDSIHLERVPVCVCLAPVRGHFLPLCGGQLGDKNWTQAGDGHKVTLCGRLDSKFEPTWRNLGRTYPAAVEADEWDRSPGGNDATILARAEPPLVCPVDPLGRTHMSLTWRARPFKWAAETTTTTTPTATTATTAKCVPECVCVCVCHRFESWHEVGCKH